MNYKKVLSNVCEVILIVCIYLGIYLMSYSVNNNKVWLIVVSVFISSMGLRYFIICVIKEYINKE